MSGLISIFCKLQHQVKDLESEKVTRKWLLLPFYSSDNKKDHDLKMIVENAMGVLTWVFFLSFSVLQNKADKSHSSYHLQMSTGIVFQLQRYL